MPLQEPPLLSLGSKGSTTMGSVPLISQRQKGHPVPWPSDSCNKSTKADVMGHRDERGWCVFICPPRLPRKTLGECSSQQVGGVTLHLKRNTHTDLSTHSYLPGGETGGAHEMTAGLDLHILVVLGTDLTQLERRAHLAVQLILLLRGKMRQLSFRCQNTVTSYDPNTIWDHFERARKDLEPS